MTAVLVIGLDIEAIRKIDRGSMAIPASASCLPKASR